MGIIALLFLLELKKQHTGSWRLRPSVIKRQLVLGRDLIIRSASLQVAFLSAAAVAARFGTAPLAARQVMLQIWNFLTLILDSLAIAAQTLIGAALGAKSVDTARNAGQKIIVYSSVFSAGLAVLFALGAGLSPRILTQDLHELEAMRIPRWIVIAMALAGGVLFAIDGVLLGAGDAAFLRTITVGSVLVGFLPGIWIAYALGFGLAGIWAGLAAFILLRTIAVVVRFYSMKWAVVS